ncbi:MAG: gamma-glutamyltransferase [Burkholderiales bacterium]|nr:gamma-glutamyltransferase [Burkholderiales bacterium]
MPKNETPPRPSWRPTVIGKRYAVACGHYLAATAAVRVLERGGNAVDAGVTAAMALAVLQPDIVSFSGVAPTLVYRKKDRSVHSLAGLGWWPQSTDIERLRSEGHGVVPDGLLRTVMPAAPATHVEALLQFGTISFEEAAAAAHEIARDGFAAYPVFVRHLEKFQDKYRRWPSSADLYLPGGRTPRIGEIFRQQQLARSIAGMMQAERNAAGDRAAKLRAARDYYYKGPIAEGIAAFHREHRGFVTRDDLAAFTVPVEKSISCTYKSHQIHSCDTWCQGISLLQALKTLETVDLAALGHNTPAYIHMTGEALNLAFADREAYVGDPRFVDVPVPGMLSAEYAAAQRARIDIGKAFGTLPLPGRPPGATRDAFVPVLSSYPAAAPGAALDTIYCCVVDADGNAYSATLSDNARDTPVIPSLGGTVSSRGAQGRLEPGHPAEVKPGKRPRLTPAPALALDNGEFVMGFGTPGGDVQTQAMLQVYLNITEFGMSVQQAIEEPRFGTFIFPNSFSPHAIGKFNVESRVPESTLAALKNLGHPVQSWSALTPAAGAVCAIRRDAETGWLHAGADPRREAYAIAW